MLYGGLFSFVVVVYTVASGELGQPEEAFQLLRHVGSRGKEFRPATHVKAFTGHSRRRCYPQNKTIAVDGLRLSARDRRCLGTPRRKFSSSKGTGELVLVFSDKAFMLSQGSARCTAFIH